MGKRRVGLGYIGKEKRNDALDLLVQCADESERLLAITTSLEQTARANKVARLIAQAQLALLQIPVEE